MCPSYGCTFTFVSNPTTKKLGSSRFLTVVDGLRPTLRTLRGSGIFGWDDCGIGTRKTGGLDVLLFKDNKLGGLNTMNRCRRSRLVMLLTMSVVGFLSPHLSGFLRPGKYSVVLGGVVETEEIRFFI